MYYEKEKCSYFEKENVYGHYMTCKICRKIPTTIYRDSSTFSGIHRCSCCLEKPFVPQGFWEKFWYKIDNTLNFIK